MRLFAVKKDEYSQHNELNVPLESTLARVRSDSRGFSLLFWFLVSVFVAGMTFLNYARETFGSVEGDQAALKVVMISDQAMKSSAADENIQVGQILTVGDVVSTSGQMNLSIFSQGLIRVFPGSKFEIVDLSGKNASEKFISIHLVEGRIWLNSLLLPVTVNVFTEHQVFVSRQAIFGVSRSAALTDLYVHRHSVLSGFLLSFSRDERQILNSLQVVEGFKLQVDDSQVDERLEKLLNSKMLKIFPVEAVSKQELESDEWTAFNTKQDQKFLLTQTENQQLYLRDRSLESRLADILGKTGRTYYRKLASVLTFEKKRKNDLLTSDAIAIWESALKKYFDKEKDPADQIADEFLQLWQSLLSQRPEDLPLFREIIQKERAYFVSILPDDKLYPAKEIIRNLWRESFVDKIDVRSQFLLLREKLYEAYDLLYLGKLDLGQKHYFDYLSELEKFLGEHDLSAAVDLLLEERILILSFLKKNPGFYELAYYQPVYSIEQEIFYYVSDVVARDEYRIAFVSDKLRVLSNLIELVNKELLSLEKSAELGNKLVLECREYQEKTGISVASEAYFAQKIEEFELLFEFFKSPEFEASNYRFVQEVFEQFLASRTAYIELEKYLKTLQERNPDQQPALNDESIKREIIRTFEKEGFFASEIVSLGDPGQRLFSLGKVVYKGLDFKANYDRVTSIVYEIDFGDKFVSAGKTLQNLMILLETNSEQPDDQQDLIPIGENTQTKNDEVQDLTAAVAIRFVQEEFKKAGISALEEQIKVVGLKNDHFFVDHVQDISRPEVVFSFDYLFDENQVLEIVLHLENQDRLIAGKYNLAGVIDLVRAEYEKALDEQQEREKSGNESSESEN